MIFFSVQEVLWMLFCALVLDRLIGDPRRLVHPVVLIGKGIKFLENGLLPHRAKQCNGIVLTVVVTIASFAVVWGICAVTNGIHPWLGYAFNIWFIATTISARGLRDAAIHVYRPLVVGDLESARANVGMIVGRDTQDLDEREVSRAAIETVAENIVDAVVAPLFYAFLGAAPLAMLYRATNTLDSMVGYRNEKYARFGWASARWDDVLNFIPARLAGMMLVLLCCFSRRTSARNSLKAIAVFAHLHPSPNSGIPESAVAGALGIQLGGTNRYGGIVSERARMGWPRREIAKDDILHAVRLLSGVSYLIAGGVLCVCLGLGQIW